ncbi:hypothetical protein OG755_05830 [Streptomyces sp. NBC_01443]|nr:hypothetical protein [Streptomyces sp. NBC_01443]
MNRSEVHRLCPSDGADTVLRFERASTPTEACGWPRCSPAEDGHGAAVRWGSGRATAATGEWAKAWEAWTSHRTSAEKPRSSGLITDARAATSTRTCLPPRPGRAARAAAMRAASQRARSSSLPSGSGAGASPGETCPPRARQPSRVPGGGRFTSVPRWCCATRSSSATTRI